MLSVHSSNNLTDDSPDVVREEETPEVPEPERALP